MMLLVHPAFSPSVNSETPVLWNAGKFLFYGKVSLGHAERTASNKFLTVRLLQDFKVVMYNVSFQVGYIECGFSSLITEHFFHGLFLGSGVIWNALENIAPMCTKVSKQLDRF